MGAIDRTRKTLWLFVVQLGELRSVHVGHVSRCHGSELVQQDAFSIGRQELAVDTPTNFIFIQLTAQAVNLQEHLGLGTIAAPTCVVAPFVGAPVPTVSAVTRAIHPTAMAGGGGEALPWASSDLVLYALMVAAVVVLVGSHAPLRDATRCFRLGHLCSCGCLACALMHDFNPQVRKVFSTTGKAEGVPEKKAGHQS